MQHWAALAPSPGTRCGQANSGQSLRPLLAAGAASRSTDVKNPGAAVPDVR